MILNELQPDESVYFDATVPLFDKRHTEECLPDDRASIRPSEAVQQKFLSLLSDTPVPVSCLHNRRMTRR